MNCYGGDITDGFHIPDLSEKLFLGEYVVRILRKESEKIELFCGEGLFFAFYEDTACGFVNAESADLYNIVLRFLLTRAYQSVVS